MYDDMVRVAIYSTAAADVVASPEHRDWRLEAVWEDGQWTEGTLPTDPTTLTGAEVLERYTGPTVFAFDASELPDYLPPLPEGSQNDTTGVSGQRRHSRRYALDTRRQNARRRNPRSRHRAQR